MKLCEGEIPKKISPRYIEHFLQCTTQIARSAMHCFLQGPRHINSFLRNGEITRLNKAILSLLIFSVERVNSILKITSCSFFVSLSREVFWSNQGRQAFFVIAIRCWLFLLNQSHRPSVMVVRMNFKKSLSSNKRLKIGHYRNRRPSFFPLYHIRVPWHIYPQ